MSYLAMIDQHVDMNGKRRKFLKEKGQEVRKNALSDLCYYDPRSSSWYEVIIVPKDCYCDNCFNQKHETALVILEMLDLLEG